MFERRTDYPAAVTSSDDDGIVEGFQWCVSHLEDGDSLAVWTHQTNNLGNNPTLESLVDRHGLDHIAARDGGSMCGPGPVIMAWASPNDIAEFMDFNSEHVRALCVISRNEDRLAPWAAMMDAKLLGNLRGWIPAVPDLGPVVLEEMANLTRLVNHNNTITGGDEKDDVVRVLLDLYDAGYELDGRIMSAWATANGWCGRNPAELENYIEKINGGGRPRTRLPRQTEHFRQFKLRRMQ